MITRNTDKLRREVAAHVAADTIVQGDYWDEETLAGCFIGCLAHGDNPGANETEYGLPVMLQRIAENIFEALPADEAKTFFAALPDAVGCDGKDLTKVGWQFLAAELRSLPPQPPNMQAVIGPVIAGLDLLAAGQDWPHAQSARAYAARAAADAYAAHAVNAHACAVNAHAYGVNGAAYAVNAAAAAHAYAVNAHAYGVNGAAYAVNAAAYAAHAAAHAAHAAYAAAHDAHDANVYADARLRQRDLLLQLISQAPTP